MTEPRDDTWVETNAREWEAFTTDQLRKLLSVLVGPGKCNRIKVEIARRERMTDA